MSQKESTDDTSQSGFVSAIVLKFTNIANKKCDSEASLRLKEKYIPPRKPEDVVLEKEKTKNSIPNNEKNTMEIVAPVRKRIEQFSAIIDGHADRSRTSSFSSRINAEFQVIGEISVKDRIRAFTSLNQAVKTAANRPEVMKVSRFAKKTPSKTEHSHFDRSSNTSIGIMRDTIDKKVDMGQRESVVSDTFTDQKIEQLPMAMAESYTEQLHASDSYTFHKEETGSTKTAGESNFEGTIQEDLKSSSSATLEDNSSKPSTDPSTPYHFSRGKVCSSHDTFEQPCQSVSSDTKSRDSTSSCSELLREFEGENINSSKYELYEPTDDPGYYPLPASYIVSKESNGGISIILPECTKRSAIKGNNPKLKVSTTFDVENLKMMETYSVHEYSRGDDSIDPLTASAEYEFEKKTELLEKFEVVVTKDERGLGMSIVGIGLGSEVGTEKLGIYIKDLTPGGASEKIGLFRVHDQILEVNGVPLVAVTQAFAAKTLRTTSKVVRFLIGREKANQMSEES